MEDINYALASHGATVVDVSHEALHVASAASNLLLEKEDMLWITGEAPQHVTIRITGNHPPLLYVGWHVWHDYLSNPKVVEVSSGVVPDCLTPMIICTALPGAGTQLWELPSPIPPAHTFVRFRIQSTFAPGPTYMNHLALFAQHPGARYSSSQRSVQDSVPLPTSRQTSLGGVPSREQSRSFPPSTTDDVGREISLQQHRQGSDSRGNTSSSQPLPTMSTLLKDLDEDIRSLQPIRTVSPSKNMILFSNGPPLPSLVEQEIMEHRQQQQQQQQQQHYSEGRMMEQRNPLQVVDNTTFRLTALEQAVLSLTRALENQRQDIQSIKELLAEKQQRERSAAQLKSAQLNAAPPPPVKFPEESLKSFVEEVLAPKLQKFAKKTEAKTLERFEEHIDKLMSGVTEVVDQRVRGYLHHFAQEHPTSRFGTAVWKAGAQGSRGAPSSTKKDYSLHYASDDRDEDDDEARRRENISSSSFTGRQMAMSEDAYGRPLRQRPSR